MIDPAAVLSDQAGGPRSRELARVARNVESPVRVTVVGAGYVGLVTGVGLAELGHVIELVETRPDRLQSLQRGRSPIHEPGVQELLTSHLATGRLRVTGRAAGPADVVMVCVGTPIGADGRSDLGQLKTALGEVTGLLGSSAPLVIRSTLPPGSSEIVAEWAGVSTSRILLNPEFLRQGTALSDFLAPTRIVIGHFPDVRPEAVDLVLAMFDALDGPRLVVDCAAAELIKNGANAFLALKLSFTNEIAAMCEEFGTDAGQVLQGIGLDPRIGGSYMRPSLGFGGSCLPKELRAMTAAGRARGLPMHVASAASDANAATQRRFADRIADALGGASGRRVAMLGLAFKAGTDDVRDSPALEVAAVLIEQGATVVGYDPAAGRNAGKALPGLVVADTAEHAVASADAVVIGTEWPEFAELDWPAIAATLAGLLLIDGRRVLDQGRMERLGFRYLTVGRGGPARTRVHASGSSGREYP
jgi:UDPglucose 6-dehydrogenase